MTTEIQTKREGLKAISRLIQQLVKEGVYTTVNEGLADMYNKEGHTEIHSFKSWLSKGFVVRKGEKALLLWGQPRSGGKQEKPAEGEAEEFSFFPLAYVFSQKQVSPITKKQHA